MQLKQENKKKKKKNLKKCAGPPSEVGSESDSESRGRWFEPRFGHIISLRFLRPFSPFRSFKKGSCQLLAKEWVLSTGKLPRRPAQEQDHAQSDLKCVEGS